MSASPSAPPTASSPSCSRPATSRAPATDGATATRSTPISRSPTHWPATRTSATCSALSHRQPTRHPRSRENNHRALPGPCPGRARDRHRGALTRAQPTFPTPVPFLPGTHGNPGGRLLALRSRLDSGHATGAAGDRRRSGAGGSARLHDRAARSTHRSSKRVSPDAEPGASVVSRLVRRLTRKPDGPVADDAWRGQETVLRRQRGTPPSIRRRTPQRGCRHEARRQESTAPDFRPRRTTCAVRHPTPGPGAGGGERGAPAGIRQPRPGPGRRQRGAPPG